MSWGYRVTILFSGFVLFMLFMVSKAFKSDVDLVSEDYYEKEIRYQEHIDKMNNANDMGGQIAYTQTKEELIIKISNPGNNPIGEITFFRPSDYKKDLKKTLALNNNQEQHFNKNLFLKGYYKVQIDWEASGRKYFTEEKIFIQ